MRPSGWFVLLTRRWNCAPVTVVRYGERDVWIASGLKAGERIVMQGVHTVSAGEKVAPIAPPHPEDAPQ